MAGASGMVDEVSESFLSLESDPDLEPSSPKRSKISSAVVTRKCVIRLDFNIFGRKSGHL